MTYHICTNGHIRRFPAANCGFCWGKGTDIEGQPDDHLEGVTFPASGQDQAVIKWSE